MSTERRAQSKKRGKIERIREMSKGLATYLRETKKKRMKREDGQRFRQPLKEFSSQRRKKRVGGNIGKLAVNSIIL